MTIIAHCVSYICIFESPGSLILSQHLLRVFLFFLGSVDPAHLLFELIA